MGSPRHVPLGSPLSFTYPPRLKMAFILTTTFSLKDVATKDSARAILTKMQAALKPSPEGPTSWAFTEGDASFTVTANFVSDDALAAHRANIGALTGELAPLVNLPCVRLPPTLVVCASDICATPLHADPRSRRRRPNVMVLRFDVCPRVAESRS